MSQDRPPIPFEIEMTESVRDFVNEELQFDPAFEWRWRAILEVLEVAGDQAGFPIAGGPVARGFEFTLGDWSLKLVWQFANGKVRIVAVRYPGG